VLKTVRGVESGPRGRIQNNEKGYFKDGWMDKSLTLSPIATKLIMKHNNNKRIQVTSG